MQLRGPNVPFADYTNAVTAAILGNFPEAFTHVALISTATYLGRVLSGKGDATWR